MLIEVQIKVLFQWRNLFCLYRKTFKYTIINFAFFWIIAFNIDSSSFKNLIST